MSTALALRVTNRRRGSSPPKLLTAATGPKWRTAPGPLKRPSPGAAVTLSAVQGGAGVSSMTLLLSTAIGAESEKPTLAVDASASTTGGLGALAGVYSEAPAEATALMVYDGTPLARPYATTEDGVHLIGARPELAITAGTLGEAVIARITTALTANAGDSELAAICRDAIGDRQLEQFCGERNGPGADALVRFLVSARTPHSLVAVDLGVTDIAALNRYARRSDLHVWVIAAREHEMESLAARLSVHPAIATNEVIVAWVPPDQDVRTRTLRELSTTRGCPVVRLPTYPAASDWGERAAVCRGSLEAVCSLLP